MVILVVLFFIAISVNPPAVLFIGFTGYALSGPILTIRLLRSKRKLRKERSKFAQKNQFDQ